NLISQPPHGHPGPHGVWKGNRSPQSKQNVMVWFVGTLSARSTPPQEIPHDEPLVRPWFVEVPTQGETGGGVGARSWSGRVDCGKVADVGTPCLAVPPLQGHIYGVSVFPPCWFLGRWVGSEPRCALSNMYVSVRLSHPISQRRHREPPRRRRLASSFPHLKGSDQ
ncbi:hypothetical protein CLAIMM_07741 isoform 4, partial [Cladophialophora immunda]